MALLFMLCLENIGSHSYADFPNVDTFCYTIEKKKKKKHAHYHPGLVRKSFQC